MKKDIVILPLKADALTVSYTNSNAQAAFKVTERLASMFRDGNVLDRENVTFRSEKPTLAAPNGAVRGGSVYVEVANGVWAVWAASPPSPPLSPGPCARPPQVSFAALPRTSSHRWRAGFYAV